jgi:hypothetical protein
MKGEGKNHDITIDKFTLSKHFQPTTLSYVNTFSPFAI